MPLVHNSAVPKTDTSGLLILIGLEIVLVALLAGLWLPAKIGRWCFRLVTTITFSTLLAILLAGFFPSSKPFANSRRAGQQKPFEALPAFLFIGLPCLWFTLTGRFSLRPEKTTEELAAEHAQEREFTEALLLAPDWASYERHLQRPAPATLRDLYADEKFITSTLLDVSDACSINTFEPLIEDRLIETAAGSGLWIIPIATSDDGNPIYLKPGPSESDAIYMTWQDGGDTEILAVSVSALVEHLKRKTMDEALT